MIGRHYIYGIDYVSGPFSEVVDFIEEAHNDKSAVLIGFAPMTSAANAVRNKEYRNILNSFDIVCMDGASIVRKSKTLVFGEQSVVAVRRYAGNYAAYGLLEHSAFPIWHQQTGSGEVAQ